MDIWKKEEITEVSKSFKDSHIKKFNKIVLARSFKTGNLKIKLLSNCGDSIENLAIEFETPYDLNKGEFFLNTKEYPWGEKFILANKLGSFEEYEENHLGFNYPLYKIDVKRVQRYNGKEKK